MIEGTMRRRRHRRQRASRSRNKLVNRRLLSEQLEQRQLLAGDTMPVVGLPEDISVSDGIVAYHSISSTDRIGQFGAVANQLLFRSGSVPLQDSQAIQEVDGRTYLLDNHHQGTTLHVFTRDDSGELDLVQSQDIELVVRDMFVDGDQVVLLGYGAEVSLEAEVTHQLLDLSQPESYAITVSFGDETVVTKSEISSYDRAIHDGNHIALVRGETVFPDPEFADGELIIGFEPDTSEDAIADFYQSNDLSELDNLDGGSNIARLVAVAEVNDETIDELASDSRVRYAEPNYIVHLTQVPRPFPQYTETTTVYRITSDGLSTVDTVELSPGSQLTFHGEDLYAVEHQVPNSLLQHLSHTLEDIDLRLSRLRIGESSVERVATLDFGPAFFARLFISNDGSTATLTAQDLTDSSVDSVLHLLDLSDDGINLFESISVGDGALAVGSAEDDFVVFVSAYPGGSNNQLVIVNVDQSIDIAAELRVDPIELPEHFSVVQSPIRVGEQLVLFGLDSSAPSRALDWPATAKLISISLSDASILATTNLEHDRANDFFLIDAETNRVGWIESDGSDDTIVYATLSDDGEFLDQDRFSIERHSALRAGPSSLLVHEFDRFSEYFWDGETDPNHITLREPPPIKAVDDYFTIEQRFGYQYLDLLENDEFDRYRSPEIVELFDAPDSTEILANGLIKVPAQAFRESTSFDYVIFDGVNESRATVEIDVTPRFDDDVVDDLVQQIREDLADDFEIDIERIVVTFVEEFADEPLPIVLRDGTSFVLENAILVTLNTGDGGNAIYGANLDGRIIQIDSHRGGEIDPTDPSNVPVEPGILVEIGLKPVDEDGAELVEIFEGDEFWLELTAEDLRVFGGGVFAAYIDLEWSSDSLSVTGDAIYLDSYYGRKDGIGLSEDGFDEVGAYDQNIRGPNAIGAQSLMRVPVKALASGEITLQPKAAEHNDTLIRGSDYPVAESNIRFSPLTLNVIAPPPVLEFAATDTNADGELTSFDALMVVDFLSENGVTSLTEFESAMAAQGESPAFDMAAIRRLDTNANGEITPLDALLVVNDLSDQFRLAQAAVRAQGESVETPVQEPTATVDATAPKLANFGTDETPVAASDFGGDKTDESEDTEIEELRSELT